MSRHFMRMDQIDTRRIGGLEILLSAGRSHFTDTRRIGGLENVLLNGLVLRSDTRRIGGLEMLVGGEPI